MITKNKSIGIKHIILSVIALIAGIGNLPAIFEPFIPVEYNTWLIVARVISIAYILCTIYSFFLLKGSAIILKINTISGMISYFIPATVGLGIAVMQASEQNWNMALTVMLVATIPGIIMFFYNFYAFHFYKKHQEILFK